MANDFSRCDPGYESCLEYQAKIERLTAALKEIAEYPGAVNDDAEPVREIARGALDQQKRNKP